MAEHDTLMTDREWPYVVELAETGSALLYYGSWHTDDPDDPQIADIEARWDAFQPTVTVTENRGGLTVGGIRRSVSRHGEFGAVVALARRDEVPVYSLEPSWEDEVREVTAEVPVAEATLFYTLRVFYSERGADRSAEDIDKLAAHLLRKRGARPGLDSSLPDLPAMDALWEEHYAHLGAWRDLPHEAVSPAPNPTRLQATAVLANEVRDRHAARVILDLLQQGHRVFAIAGGSHVVKQEPVLRVGVAPDTSSAPL